MIRGRVVLWSLAWLLVACRPQRDERAAPRAGELETIDVGEKLDATASLEDEIVERRRSEPTSSPAGVLPEGFPRDVPLPLPSSLVDFAQGERGALSITLETRGRLDVVLPSYERVLAGAGFDAVGGSRGEWRRGDRRLRVTAEEVAGVARITLETWPGRE